MLFDAVIRHADFAPQQLWTFVYASWVIGGTIFLLLRRRRPTTTLAWILAFWSLPIISGLAYFLFGPRRLDDESELRQKARRVAAQVIPDSASQLPEQFADTFSLASLACVTRSDERTGQGSGAGSGLKRVAGYAPKQAAGIELYADGDECFPAILKAIHNARSTLHLEYYIWLPDVMGTRLREALIERARAGITVRIVVDAIGAKDCHGGFWQPLVDAGGEIRKFNPQHLLKPQPGKLNFRTHRKIIIIDAMTAFTGGVNICDNNLSIASVSGKQAWRSTHLRLDGPPALDLQAIFLEDWLYSIPVDAVRSNEHASVRQNSGDTESLSLPDDINTWFSPSFQNSTRADDRARGPWVQIIDSGPDEIDNDIHLLYFTAITSAQKRLWITTPYFVPDAPIETALKSAARRGVDVRIILPAQCDSKLVKAASKTYTFDAAKAGARIWHYEPCMNHAKVMIVDEELAIIGTANMDNRSFRLNFEVVAAIHDRQVTEQVCNMFENDLKSSRPYEPQDSNPGVLERIMANAARLLAPLL